MTSLLRTATLWLVLLAATATPSLFAQQQIKGVVNRYTIVFSIDDCNRVHVEQPGIVEVGDRVLIIQMQGTLIDTTNTVNYGKIQDLRSAGACEYAQVRAIDGQQVTLEAALVNRYQVDDYSVQMIYVPEYTDVTVTGLLSCMPWDGRIGGVLAVHASNRITLAADVNVSGFGFRGGTIENQEQVPNAYITGYRFEADPTYAARRGEGVAGYGAGPFVSGRGAAANAGGGGNHHNGGGGGGANGGCGGTGGWGYKHYRYSGDFMVCSGLGGRSLMHDGRHLFAGGGGGAGHGNNGSAMAGGNGGAIVLLDADTIAGAGGTIRSNGVGIDRGGPDGSGGGGAGGTVALRTGLVLGALHVQAHGGNGGSTGDANENHGPGGGGGGGVVLLPNDAAAPQLTVQLAAGINGVTPSRPDGYGAKPGCAGQFMRQLEIAQGTEVLLEQRHVDTTICPDETLQLIASDGETVRWSPADGLSCTDCPSPVARPGRYTQYIAEVTTAAGCTIYDTTTVSVVPRIAVRALAADATGEPGDTVAVPLLLDNLQGEPLRQFDLVFEHDSLLAKFIDFLPTGVLRGWSVAVIEQIRGRVVLRLTAPQGQFVDHADSAGYIRYRLYLSEYPTSRIRVEMRLIDSACTVVEALDGRLEMTICGLSNRLIELATARYAIEILPNPVVGSAQVNYIVALDGPTRLEIFDSRGNLVAMPFNSWHSAGNYTINWDASTLPAGTYLYRLTSGSFVAEGTVVVVE